MKNVQGPDPTGEREQVYEYLEQLAADREQNERGRGLSTIVRKMNYVETHFLSAVAEKSPALIKKVLGRRRWQELVEEQKERMAMDNQQIAGELVRVARSLTAFGRFKINYELDKDDLPALRVVIEYNVGRFTTVSQVNKIASEVVSLCGKIGSLLSRVAVATSSSYSDDPDKCTVVSGTVIGNININCRKQMDKETRQNVVFSWSDTMARFDGRLQ